MSGDFLENLFEEATRIAFTDVECNNKRYGAAANQFTIVWLLTSERLVKCGMQGLHDFDFIRWQQSPVSL